MSQIKESITHKHVVKVAVPMTLAYLSEPLIGLTDTAVIGQLGEESLIAGIGVSANLFAFMLVSFNFFRSGTTGLTAQAKGAEDTLELTATLLRYAGLAFLIGLVLILVQIPILQAGQWFFQQSDAVNGAIGDYYFIRIYALPLILMNFVAAGWLIGYGKNYTVLLLTFMLGVINIALNLYLGLYLGMGVKGIALASVIAELSLFLVAATIILTQHDLKIRDALSSLLISHKLIRMVQLNRDIMIRSLALTFAFSWFTRLAAPFGDTVVAANVILMTFLMIIGYFLDGMATAAEQLGGQAIGAKSRQRFDQATQLSILWSWILAALLSFFFFILQTPLIHLMTTAEDVRVLAHEYVLWIILLPLAANTAFVMDGIYIGATWSVHMRNTMLFSLTGYLIATFSLIPLMGNHGLWFSLVLFMILRGISMRILLPSLRGKALDVS